MAPMISQVNPNIAIRASRRVPDRLREVVAAMSTSAITVVAAGMLARPNKRARNGAMPVATPAMVQQSAQP
jgi:hypothetical protein